jgi:hypothetical protein
MTGLTNGEFDEPHYHWTLANTGMAVRGARTIPESWILLDNQSTVDMFANASLLRNIRKATSTMKILCNAGVAMTNLIGELPGYGTVWYNKDSIANILSLARVKKKFQVMFDSGNHNGFIVHKANGEQTVFKESDQGLFYLDTDESQQEGLIMLNTIAENKAEYTVEAYTRATLARKIQIMIGRPSTKEFVKIVDNHLLPNCPITREDIKAAENIFGPDLGSLKGKTVRRAPTAVRPELVAFPPDLMEHHKSVTLCADIMFINKIPFLVTCSRKLKFGTTELLKNREKKTILAAIQKTIKIYKRRSLQVEFMLMDGEFEPIRDDLMAMGISLNMTTNNEHVSDIK